MTPEPKLPGGPSAPQRTSGLAIATLIVMILGFCFPPLWLVAIVLGILALGAIKKDPSLGGRALAIVGIAVPAAFLVISIPLAAIAIPNFIKFQSRAKQTECKVNLRAMYTATMSRFSEHDAHDTRISELGFTPERGNRYAYFLSPDGPLQDRSTASIPEEPGATGVGVDTFRYGEESGIDVSSLPPTLAGGVPVGLSGQCPDCALTMACAGNVDSDATLDVWSVSTQDRKGPGGQVIRAGELFNDVNDP